MFILTSSQTSSARNIKIPVFGSFKAAHWAKVILRGEIVFVHTVPYMLSSTTLVYDAIPVYALLLPSYACRRVKERVHRITVM